MYTNMDTTNYDVSDSDNDEIGQGSSNSTTGSTSNLSSTEEEEENVTFDMLVRKNIAEEWDDTSLMPGWDRKFYSGLDQVMEVDEHPVHGCGWKPGLAHVWNYILDYLDVSDRYYLCMAFPNIKYADKKGMRMEFQEYELNNNYVCHYCFIRCQYESQLQTHIESMHRIMIQKGGKRKLIEGPRARVIDYFPEFYLPTLMYNHKVYTCPLCREDAISSNGLVIHFVYLHMEFFCLKCKVEIRGMCSFKSHCESFHKEMEANNQCQSCFDEMVCGSSYELYRHCIMDHWKKKEMITFFGWETEELLIDVLQTVRDLCVYGYSLIRTRMDKNLPICQWLKKNKKNWKPRNVNICRKNKVLTDSEMFTLLFPSPFTDVDDMEECDTDCECDIFVGNEIIPATNCTFAEWVIFKENVQDLL